MSEAILSVDIEHLITEDDEPVDNILTEKQERLLTEPLYSSWRLPDDRPFMVAANVGVFNSVHLPAIVPDVFLSLDVQVNPEWNKKEHKSYFVWEFGKVPDVVIEIVSNKVGEENTKKMTRYAHMGIPYYVIFDPYRELSQELLVIYVLQFRNYTRLSQTYLPHIGLGLTFWEGEFENAYSDFWLRWTDERGQIIPTGLELAEMEKQRADAEKQRADTEKQRADIEKQRAERLAAKLRELGLDPDIF